MTEKIKLVLRMTFEQALKTGRKIGAAHADDVQLMAMLLESVAQLELGAVSPKLIFNGAQKRGMTSKDLMRLIHDDPDAARDLMWEE